MRAEEVEQLLHRDLSAVFTIIHSAAGEVAVIDDSVLISALLLNTWAAWQGTRRHHYSSFSVWSQGLRAGVDEVLDALDEVAEGASADRLVGGGVMLERVRAGGAFLPQQPLSVGRTVVMKALVFGDEEEDVVVDVDELYAALHYLRISAHTRRGQVDGRGPMVQADTDSGLAMWFHYQGAVEILREASLAEMWDSAPPRWSFQKVLY